MLFVALSYGISYGGWALLNRVRPQRHLPVKVRVTMIAVLATLVFMAVAMIISIRSGLRALFM